MLSSVSRRFVLLLAACTLATLFTCTQASDSLVPGKSAGGKAACITGVIHVDVSSENIKLLLNEPADQAALTEVLVELLQVDSTIANTTNGGPNNITGHYGIYSKLCVPTDPAVAKSVSTVQFLTHGDTLYSGYWDIAPGYSYVDAAAQAGYATFSYDKIGVGKSDHPDPIQVVQGPLQVEIAHALVQLLRSAQIGNRKFKKVIGVGHSAGSTITVAVSAKYPKDFDAVIISGTTVSTTYVPLSLASFSFAVAKNDSSGKFAGLPNAYIVQATPQSLQFPFYRYPNFDPAIFTIQYENKQTQTLGELLTLASIVGPAAGFTGPVDVVNGENDLVFCGGDCTYPTDQNVPVIPAFYPKAGKGSQTFLVPGAGHAINAHKSAPKAFDQMLGFLKTNGIL